MFRCKVNLLLLSLISIFITAHLPVWAKETHDAFFENISNMYRLEAYLPAIDKLEGLKDASFKSEILRARGCQKTKQLRKALISYQKAYELNPKGSELSKQIKILKRMIKANSEELNLSSSGNQKIISKERATVDNIIKRARSKLKDAKTDAEKEAVLESLKKKIIEKQKSGDLPRSKKVQKKPKSQGKTMEQYMKEKGL